MLRRLMFLAVVVVLGILFGFIVFQLGLRPGTAQ